jgi:hypothetical protein
MRKLVLLLIVLLLALVAGCGDGAASPTSALIPSPVPTFTPPPSPTSAPEEATAAPEVSAPSSPTSASCVANPFDFPLVPGVPSITDEDHGHGPADASIALIEYADFQ